MEQSDKNLVAAHCEGDTQAFGEIIRRYGDVMLGYLAKMCGNREKAEDFFQETFQRVHQKAHTFRGERLKPWLLTIAMRVAINGLRKTNKLPAVSLNQTNCDGDCEIEVEIKDDSQNPAQQVMKNERKEQVRAVIAILPPKQRATLILAYYQQLSYPEIAQVMGCSVGTVKTQMYRALRMLAEKLPSGDIK
ncbi:MAG: RNA polymerase sigma factor [Phycisphaerae bacterium]|nr:RNA polymerase sigma factor [Phycisphaerae bacterium]